MQPFSTADAGSTLRLIESAYQTVYSELLGHQLDWPHDNDMLGLYTYHDPDRFIIVCGQGGEGDIKLALLLPKGPLRNFIPQLVSSEEGQKRLDFIKSISREAKMLTAEETAQLKGEVEGVTVDDRAKALLRMLEQSIDTRAPDALAKTIKDAIRAARRARTTKAPTFTADPTSVIYRDRIAPLLGDLLPFEKVRDLIYSSMRNTGMNWRLPSRNDFGYGIIFKNVSQSIFKEDYHDPDSLWDMPDEFLMGDLLFWSRDRPVSRASHCAVPIAGPLYDAMVNQQKGRFPRRIRQVAPHVFQDSSVCWGGLQHDIGDDPVQAIDFGPIIIGGWNQSSSYMHPRDTYVGIVLSEGGFAKTLPCCGHSTAFKSKADMLKLGVRPLMPAKPGRDEEPTTGRETPQQAIARLFDKVWTQEKTLVFDMLAPVPGLRKHLTPNNWNTQRAHWKQRIIDMFAPPAGVGRTTPNAPMRVGSLVCPQCIKRDDPRFHVDAEGVLRVGPANAGGDTKGQRQCRCRGCPNFHRDTLFTCSNGCSEMVNWRRSIDLGVRNYWDAQVYNHCFACSQRRPPALLDEKLMETWLRAYVSSMITQEVAARFHAATFPKEENTVASTAIRELTTGNDHSHYRHMYLCDNCRDTKFFKED